MSPREVEVSRYASTRGAIRDADVVLFQGSSLLSKICSLGTGGDGYSHAGLVFWQGDRVRLIHATAKGVHEEHLSEQLRIYEGAVELWRLKAEHAEAFDAEGAIRAARKRLGARYAYWIAALFGVDFLFRRLVGRSLRARSRSKRELVCSQLVSVAYRKGGGVDLNRKRGDAATSPVDLIRGGRIELVRAFARDDLIDRAR